MRTIILSRLDNIGDVVLTLPLCAWLKQRYEHVKIVFLARGYVAEILACCPDVDEFLNWDECRNFSATKLATTLQQYNADAMIHVTPNQRLAFAAKQANIPRRIGTNRRWYNWLNCNERVNLSRRNAKRHEAELNMTLLQRFGYQHDLSLAQIGHSIHLTAPHPESNRLLDPNRFSIIIHPGSNGNTKEWPVESFYELITQLQASGFQIILSGSAAEACRFQTALTDRLPNVINTMGQLSLTELIALIAAADCFIGGSTGPTHIAAALHKPTIGLFPPCQGRNPERWAALGPSVHNIVATQPCQRCDSDADSCMRSIAVLQIINTVTGIQTHHAIT